MTLAATKGESALSPASFVDACVFHEWASSKDLLPYMSAGWRDLVMPPGTGRASAVTVRRWFVNPTGEKAEKAYPKHGPAGSDFETLTTQLFEGDRRQRAVLAYEEGFYATAFGNLQASIAFARAVNDWSIEKWLQRDDRLFGMILIASQVPTEAAAEIRRVGREKKMVGVALGANALGKPFGHPAYHPIYEAATEMELPVMIQVGTEASVTSSLPPVGGGMPSTYSEYRTLNMHGIMSHVASMITEGIFGLFPRLKLLLVGPGATWLPGYLWRLNYYYKRDQGEMPWLTRFPTDIFREHVRIATNSLESPRRADDLVKMLRTLPWIQEALLYASGYPNFDFEEADQQAKRLPVAWHEDVFYKNALAFFRWPAL